MYSVILNKKAKRDLEFHENSGNKPLVHKLYDLLEELREHPHTGTGKPEQLKHNHSGKWSRRINNEHRLIYSIENNNVIVEVISARGHY